MKDVRKKSYWSMIWILLTLLVVSSIAALLMSSGDNNAINYNTAIIPIKGTLTTEGASGFFDEGITNSNQITRIIEDIEKDPNVKAVILEINSPGGSAVATDEISQALSRLRQNLTLVAWIRESGASGAYWIATSSEHIVANRMSVVGSIGVIGSYIEWYGLMQRYNVSYKRLVSGQYKDAGIPYRPLTADEEALIQIKLDKIHDYFIEAVAENRNMSYSDVAVLANGAIYLGIEAEEYGLVDELGGKQEAVRYIEEKLNITVRLKEFSPQKSFIESILSASNANSYSLGRGIGSGLLDESSLNIRT